MDNEMLNGYLSSIGITGTMAARVQSIHDFYTEIPGVTVDDVFVSEYVSGDGSREYESLWFFFRSPYDGSQEVRERGYF